MNDRELFERLRREADEHTPDVNVDVRAARVQSSHGEVVAVSRKKAALISVLSALLGVVLLLAILLPVLLGGRGGGRLDPSAMGTEAGTYHGIGSKESVYGLAAVTTAKLLEKTSAGGAQNVALAEAGGSADAVAKARAEAEDFNKYFNMLDGFLDRGATTTVVEANTSKEEALAGYAFKLTITGMDVAGGSVSHTIYYSETKGETQTDRRRDGDETVSVTSTVYTLDGAMDMGGAFYYMQGTRTEQVITETEGRETETEQRSTLTMRASEAAGDTRNYVELTHTQSTEEEPGEAETEAVYTYRIYAAGRLVESTSVAFETETEHGEEETECTVRFLSGASRGAYTVERETVGGKTEMAVSYSIDGATGTFVIVKDISGAYRYQFSADPDDDLIFDAFDD